MLRACIAVTLVLMVVCSVCTALADTFRAQVGSEDLYEMVSASLEGKESAEALAADIAGEWDRVYLNPEYPLFCCGTHEPALLPVEGKHAFVLLGFQLENGEMTEELKGRCDAAAAAAKAFPDSVIVCSGGATGSSNPEGHTEAGMMKQYLAGTCGIAADRILTDECAMTTAENALNTFAILKAQGIGSITLVTSSYHQRRAHMLYYAAARWYSRTEGWSVQILGNYNFEAGSLPETAAADPVIAEFQILEILLTLSNA